MIARTEVLAHQGRGGGPEAGTNKIIEHLELVSDPEGGHRGRPEARDDPGQQNVNERKQRPFESERETDLERPQGLIQRWAQKAKSRGRMPSRPSRTQPRAEATSQEATVARAAPATPSAGTGPSPKINIGSATRLTTAATARSLAVSVHRRPLGRPPTARRK